jgi:hypothetical protein
MKTNKVLAMILAALGLLALAAPAQAQRRGGGHRHGGHHHFHHPHHHNHVGFFFGGFGGPFFWGYPSWGYPYYYGYSYPVAPYYSYDPQGIYQGRLANPPRSTNDGLGKDYSMVKRVQRQLASAGYYHGDIDGILGSGTRTAIRNYQRDNDLRVDGEIGNELLSSMERG